MWHTRSARRPLWWWGRWLLSPQKLCPHRNLRNTPVYPFRLLHLQYCEGKLVLIPTILNSSALKIANQNHWNQKNQLQSLGSRRHNHKTKWNKQKQKIRFCYITLHNIAWRNLWFSACLKCSWKFEQVFWSTIENFYYLNYLFSISAKYFINYCH